MLMVRIAVGAVTTNLRVAGKGKRLRKRRKARNDPDLILVPVSLSSLPARRRPPSKLSQPHVIVLYPPDQDTSNYVGHRHYE